MWDYFFASWQRAGQSPASPNFKMLIMATWVRMLPGNLLPLLKHCLPLQKKWDFTMNYLPVSDNISIAF